jgi:hypothetical protein
MNLAASAQHSGVRDYELAAGSILDGTPAGERRHDIQYLRYRGFDFPLALFWGAYIATCVGVVIAWLSP